MDDGLTALQGTIDGVAHTLMLLIGELEVDGRLDGPGFCQRLRSFGHSRELETPYHQCGKVMQDLADRIDEARTVRARRSGRQ
ncbi:hypothetical protein [Burkholderia glumae]|uniref:hypothetical protein n=1 Tax=Burkholderia glumae TaxID=337 RepID=UPI000F5D8CF9|nr:hypothetical protein [Burkholderia glumae]